MMCEEIKRVSASFIQDLVKNDSNHENKFLSPVNLKLHCMTKVELPELKWFHLDSEPHSTKIANTGQTVIVSGIWSKNRPRISGGPLSTTYAFYQLHYHWGGDNSYGSEHSYNDKKVPLEMHAVFLKEDCKRQEDALNEKDGAIVISYAYKLDKECNPGIKLVCDEFSKITNPSQISELADPIKLTTFVLPFQNDYFIYWGSVRTNACKHVLLWILSRQPYAVSEKQLNQFRSLFTSGHQPITNNSRNVQNQDYEVFHVNPSAYNEDVLYKKVENNECQKVIISERINEIRKQRPPSRGLKSRKPSTLSLNTVRGVESNEENSLKSNKIENISITCSNEDGKRVQEKSSKSRLTYKGALKKLSETNSRISNKLKRESCYKQFFTEQDNIEKSTNDKPLENPGKGDMKEKYITPVNNIQVPLLKSRSSQIKRYTGDEENTTKYNIKREGILSRQLKFQRTESKPRFKNDNNENKKEEVDFNLLKNSDAVNATELEYKDNHETHQEPLSKTKDISEKLTDSKLLIDNKLGVIQENNMEKQEKIDAVPFNREINGRSKSISNFTDSTTQKDFNKSDLKSSKVTENDLDKTTYKNNNNEKKELSNQQKPHNITNSNTRKDQHKSDSNLSKVTDNNLDNYNEKKELSKVNLHKPHNIYSTRQRNMKVQDIGINTMSLNELILSLSSEYNHEIRKCGKLINKAQGLKDRVSTGSASSGYSIKNSNTISETKIPKETKPKTEMKTSSVKSTQTSCLSLKTTKIDKTMPSRHEVKQFEQREQDSVKSYESSQSSSNSGIFSNKPSKSIKEIKTKHVSHQSYSVNSSDSSNNASNNQQAKNLSKTTNSKKPKSILKQKSPSKLTNTDTEVIDKQNAGKKPRLKKSKNKSKSHEECNLIKLESQKVPKNAKKSSSIINNVQISKSTKEKNLIKDFNSILKTTQKYSKKQEVDFSRDLLSYKLALNEQSVITSEKTSSTSTNSNSLRQQFIEDNTIKKCKKPLTQTPLPNKKTSQLKKQDLLSPINRNTTIYKRDYSSSTSEESFIPSVARNRHPPSIHARMSNKYEELHRRSSTRPHTSYTKKSELKKSKLMNCKDSLHLIENSKETIPHMTKIPMPKPILQKKTSVKSNSNHKTEIERPRSMSSSTKNNTIVKARPRTTDSSMKYDKNLVLTLIQSSASRLKAENENTYLKILKGEKIFKSKLPQRKVGLSAWRY